MRVQTVSKNYDWCTDLATSCYALCKFLWTSKEVNRKRNERADKINSLPGWTTREFTAIPSRNLVEQARLGISNQAPDG
jgi:hypothetical protein